MANAESTGLAGSLTGDEHIRDPFAQSGYTHPAIRENNDISSDVYRGLFDRIFRSGIFNEWLKCTHSWQLYCTGGPGTGKSTFAALAVERIREKYTVPHGRIAHVASIFIQGNVLENELTFLEDLLHSVYCQLIRSALPVGHAVSSHYQKYAQARKAGTRITKRINLVMKALQQRVIDLQHTNKAFLVIDNVDQCGVALRELLERELSTLQEAGLHILITSRLPRHGRIGRIYCNFHDRYGPPAEVYWTCAACNSSHICVDCYDEAKLCSICELETFWVEPEYIQLKFNSIPRSSIWNFIKWDLEREHGDLGLCSGHTNKPPLSQFGISFRSTRAGQAGQDWTEKIARDCSGSILRAKLALDTIHCLKTADAYKFIPRRIPTNVQAIFQKELWNIARQPASQHDLAFKSMAAVSKQGDDVLGLPLSQLAFLLRERVQRDGSRMPPRSVEDILHAAKGHLKLNPPASDDDEYTIGPFHPDFYLYTLDDYNDDLIMANAQLNTSRPPRSSTWVVPRLESLEDVLARNEVARSPEFEDTANAETPPLRKLSQGPMRSYTFISPDTSLSPPPPSGLGLIFESASYFDKK